MAGVDERLVVGRSGVVGLRAGLAAQAGVLPVATGALVEGMGSGRSGIDAVLLIALVGSSGVTAAGVCVGLVAWLAWGRRPRWGVLIGAVVAGVLVEVALWQVAPFRFGVLSVLLFAGATLAVTGAVAGRAPGRRAVAAVALVGLCVVAVPIGSVQREVGVEQWVAQKGVPSRAVARVVTVPGMVRLASVWDGTRLVTPFGIGNGPGGIDVGPDVVETVTPGFVDPCGPLLYGTGYRTIGATPPCVQEGPGLWFRGSEGNAPGYVLQRDGVTITLTGGGNGYVPDGESGWLNPDVPQAVGGRDGVRRVIEAARPATDGELQPSGVTWPGSLEEWLLL
ncbi:hypothetical protein GCM10009665_33110 [Kitasatospora nipponensis]|uniref:Uncharacterized protein n=1 Tax=Kitasatospora nipponensis TaxID=258049 RepID=A0ABN1W8V2_9ACTN